MKHHKIIIIATIVLTFFTDCSQDPLNTNLKAELTSYNELVGAKEGEKIYVNFKLDKPLSKDLVLQANFDTVGINAFTNGAADYDSAVEYSTDGGISWKKGTATNQVRFTKGARFLKVRISTKDDTIPEIRESFKFNLKSSADKDIELLNNIKPVTCMIIDDEPLPAPRDASLLMTLRKGQGGEYFIDGMASSVKSKEAKEFLDGQYKRVLEDMKKMVALAPVNLVKIELSYNPESGLGGYVAPNTPERAKNEWLMGLNAAKAYITIVNDTMIRRQSYNADGRIGYIMTHELGHLLTLNFDSQIGTLSVSKENCPTYFNQEGCSKSGSYINAYNKDFYDSAVTLNKPKFVTNYASTNLEEDMAESFAHAIVGYQLPALTPEGSGALKKVYFMKSKPKLYDLNTSIKAILGNKLNMPFRDKKVLKYNIDKQGNVISCLNRTKWLEMLKED